MEKPEDVIIEVNENAFFKLRIKKDEIPVTIDFTKNEKVLKIDSQKYNLCSDESEYTFTYSVNECVVEDAGTYQFEVSNTFGKVTVPVRLLVKCKSIFCFEYYKQIN